MILLALNFLFPGFAWALLAIAIPIIIHLFNFRRFKKVPFTNVKMLKEIKEETNSHRRIKHLLTLAARILAVSALVLAFMQPYIPVTNAMVQSAERVVSVFVDNSFSMDLAGKEGTQLQQAVSKAKDLSLAYRPSDKFQLLTNDFNAIQQRLISREEFIEQLDQVKTTTTSRSLREIYLRQQEALHAAGNASMISYIISDFQKSAFDFTNFTADTAVRTSLIHLPSQSISNVYIDTAWMENPLIRINQPVNLHVVVRNSGEKDLENIPLKLFVNNTQRSLASVNIPAGMAVTSILNFSSTTGGLQRCDLGITDFPITFDDHYYFSFEIIEKTNVAIINNQAPSPYLQSVFKADSSFQIINQLASQINYDIISKSDVVILNGIVNPTTGLSAELKKFSDGGATIVVFPDSASDINATNQLLGNLGADQLTSWTSISDKVSKIDLQNPLFKSVFDRVPDNMDLPIVSGFFATIQNSTSKREPILQLQNGIPLLAKYSNGSGQTYVFTTTLSSANSNLVNHALFAPIMYRIALLINRYREPSYIIGRDQFVSIDKNAVSGEEVFHIVNQKNSFDIIPQHQSGSTALTIFFSDQLKHAGNYDIILRDKAVASVAFNYNKSESLLQYYSADELTEQLEKNNIQSISLLENVDAGISKLINEQSEGIKLWKYCIIAALLFFAVEILILRLWKA
ncbi:MAG: BatA domain-containing protein [Bacteroidetes bacterium]|nr:BatA domain-containing protein [Bacteroidota bacterium]